MNDKNGNVCIGLTYQIWCSHLLSGLEGSSGMTLNHILTINLNVYRVIQIPEWMIKVKMFALALYDILLWMIFNQHVNVYEYQTRQWRRLRWSRRRSPSSCYCTSTLSSTLASALAAGNFFVKTRSQLVVSFQYQSWRKVVTYMWCLSLTTKAKSYKKINETAQTANFSDFYAVMF